MKQNKNIQKEFTGGVLHKHENSARGVLGNECGWGMRKGKTRVKEG